MLRLLKSLKIDQEDLQVCSGVPTRVHLVLAKRELPQPGRDDTGPWHGTFSMSHGTYVNP